MGLKDRIVCKAKHFADDWLLPLFVGGTIGAAWGGYFAAFKNHADNKKDNRVLMRKALETTEGKERSA